VRRHYQARDRIEAQFLMG